MQLQRYLLNTELSVPPSSSSSSYVDNNSYNKTRDSFINDANFDTNMVIILAALLCALICALGLNSIARCALRCWRRLTPEREAARLAGTGLKKSHLRRIPVAVYGSGEENIPATECPICLGEFEKGDKVRMLPQCNHGFHVRCIDTWLVSHSSCPNCRHSLLEKPKVVSNSSEDGGGVAGGAPSPENGSGGEGEGNVVVVVEQAS